jgi:hypothetical protein
MEMPWAINDDVENEFRYWMRELLAALKRAAYAALAAALLIALLPAADTRAEYEFARDLWPYLAELAFWLGMLVSMLWSAAKRAVAVFTGILPWQATGRPAPLQRRP